jgi:hypothetical protein
VATLASVKGKPYGYDQLAELATTKEGYPQDISALLKLLLPKSPQESAAAGAMMQPGYLSSVRLQPLEAIRRGGKPTSLDVGLFESEPGKKLDLLKFIKDIVANSKKWGYTEVSASPLAHNEQGGRSMFALMKAAGADPSGHMSVPVSQLEKLLTNKDAAKQFISSMKTVKKSKDQPYFDPLRRNQQLWEYYNPHPGDLTKQLEARYEGIAPTQAEYVSEELSGMRPGSGRQTNESELMEAMEMLHRRRFDQMESEAAELTRRQTEEMVAHHDRPPQQERPPQRSWQQMQEAGDINWVNRMLQDEPPTPSRHSQSLVYANQLDDLVRQNRSNLATEQVQELVNNIIIFHPDLINMEGPAALREVIDMVSRESASTIRQHIPEARRFRQR